MTTEVICNYCNWVFRSKVQAGVGLNCPRCNKVIPQGTSDWKQAYLEDIHKPLLKRGKGEKVDRTHSRLKTLRRKLAKLRVYNSLWQ